MCHGREAGEGLWRADGLPRCGDGVVQMLNGEECDDGGVCIGGANAGTRCVAETDCLGNGVCVSGPRTGVACAGDPDCPSSRCAHCVPFGGDGCAANCTTEHDVPFNLIPGVVQGIDLLRGTSGAVVHGNVLTIPLPLKGVETVKVGTDRGDGIIPAVIKARAVNLPIPVSTLACACPREIAVKTCGGTFLEIDGITPSLDCTSDDHVCAGRAPCTFVHGAGNAAAGAVYCGQVHLEGVDLNVTRDAGGGAGTPQLPAITRSGTGGVGSAAILLTTAIGTVVGLCTGSDPTLYGSDGRFCTDDDPAAVRGIAGTSIFVTGTATAQVNNADGLDGETVGPFSVTGHPFDCSALTQRNDTNGACFASAFTALGLPTLGDIAVTIVLCSQGATVSTPTPTPLPGPTPCVGDCDADGTVTIDEIIKMVIIALGGAPISACSGFSCGCQGPICAQVVEVDCIMQAINNVLTDCRPMILPSPTPMPTPTSICFESVGGCCDFGGRRPCYPLVYGGDESQCRYTDHGSPIGCAGSVTCNQSTGLCESR